MRTSMMILGCALAITLATGLSAQDTKTALRMPVAWGTVVSLDKEAKTLTINGRLKRDEEAKDMVFAVTDDTKVVVAGEGRETKAGTLDDVKAEKRVSVVYREAAGDAKPVALSIRIMADRPATEKKAD